MRRRILALFACLAVAGFGCTTTKTEIPFGIQSSHASFVPARIAVFPCREWPSSASFQGLQNKTLDKEQLPALCQRFDKFVLEGFNEQPYMRGLSPKAVDTLLTRSGKEELLDAFVDHWRRQPGDCEQCLNAPAFYVQSIKPRPEWQNWLSEFSRSAYNADAILLPMVLYIEESRRDSRGLTVAQREAGVVLLLINTNNGGLIWTGGRRTEATNRALESRVGQIGPPAWEVLYDRLLTGDIWREFPGRQEY